MNVKIKSPDETKTVDVISTLEGNKRLTVDTVSSTPGGLVPTLTSNLRYYDMNPSTGGVTRSTAITSAAWTNLFSVAGNGLIHGFNINLEGTADWFIRFIVDGGNVFEGYDHTYSYVRIVDATPNSFPAATYQTVTVAITQKNNTLYTVTLNSVPYSFTSDPSGTQAEITAGLTAVINAAPASPAIASGTTSLILTSKVLGTAFTYATTGPNLAATLTLANVPLEVYSQTIGSTTYNFTSDGTPTAGEVVTGLSNLITSDALSAVNPSGTTVLRLTGKVSGNYYTYSSSANLTQTLITPDIFALENCPEGCLQTNDMIGNNIYDLDSYLTNLNDDYSNIGVHFSEGGEIVWGYSSFPLKFYSSVVIQVKRKSGAANKKFNAGLMVITRGIQ